MAPPKTVSPQQNYSGMVNKDTRVARKCKQKRDYPIDTETELSSLRGSHEHHRREREARNR